MGIKRVMPDIKRHIDWDKPYIKPDINAHVGLCVPELIFEYGSAATKMKSLPRLAKYMVGSMGEMRKSYGSLYEQPENPSKSITEKDLKDLEDFAKELGAGSVGFTSVNPSYIFDDKVIIYPNAIIFTFEMKHDIIETAPSKDAENEIFRTYYELCVLVNKIKGFLNERGYNAEAGPSLGGEANYPMLAEKAGLGAVGKHGLLITPEFGPSVRLAAVYTDIENLPMKESDHLWIKSFCDKCNKCVSICPAQAIYKEPKTFIDGSLQCIDYIKCAVPFSTNKGCTRCVNACTFFKSDYEKIKDGFMKVKEGSANE